MLECRKNIDQAEGLVTLLEGAFASASNLSLISRWEQSPFLHAIRNIAKERQGFANKFVQYAGSPLHEKFPLRKTIAAYLALEASPPGSSRETEALSLFTDNLFALINLNAQCGLPNCQAHNLFVSAGKLHLTGEAHDQAVYAPRRNELIKLWPTVITRCTAGDRMASLSLAGYALRICGEVSETAEKMTDILLHSAAEIVNKDKTESDALAYVANELSAASDYIQDKPSKAQALQKIWCEARDKIDQVVSSSGIKLTRQLLSSPLRIASLGSRIPHATYH